MTTTENRERLRRILTYHVVSGAVKADRVVTMTSAKAVSGDTIMIKTMAGKVMVDNAHVTTTDILTSNGVIHVIDSVIIPAEKR